ncbi:helix-turn-helix transcriptional regulator [Prevotella sp. PINT]|jgi:Predicted transcriptional regulators|uniref:helix-turn-helix domain-containing protein n=1 Tax=Palleniella intestinalis TaxID=2736291 RepID=UPI001554F30A|nr:helix-turn-helix transcriptional regulator [Palleniella intestinalis]NPD81212.1 helix-turn-helix transcriptional regulator [Palleniella intestinalis]
MEKDFYTFEEIKDETFGIVGTPERDAYEAELKASLIGKAIKKARTEHNLTQTQLGEMIGVQRTQISKIENGRNITFTTLARIFKAMGLNLDLDMGTLGRVSLC